MFIYFKIRRQGIIKYLRQFLKVNTEHNKHPSSTMNGNIATFTLPSFDKFVTSYQSTNSLAPEALKAFDQFIEALDNFFDLYEELTEKQMQNDDVLIQWYKSAIISSGDTIRAVSDWYHQAVFDNISINMNSDEIENYITCDKMYFGKVIFGNHN